MLKLKDWPPDSSFLETAPRHYVDFVEMLNRWGGGGGRTSIHPSSPAGASAWRALALTLARTRSCVPEMCHPTLGPLNLAAKLPEHAVKPDLGPKGYVACGRWVVMLGYVRARARW